jgi:hypothetical protein
MAASPHEAVEKVQFRPFREEVTLENKGVMGTDCFGFRVFRQSQQTPAAARLQRVLRFRQRLVPGVREPDPDNA